MSNFELLEQEEKRPYAPPTFSATAKLAEVTAQTVSGVEPKEKDKK